MVVEAKIVSTDEEEKQRLIKTTTTSTNETTVVYDPIDENNNAGQGQGTEIGTHGLFYAIILFLNAAIGVGFLNAAYIVGHSGIFGALLMLLWTAMCCGFGLHLLILSSRKLNVEVTSYSMLAEAAFPNYGNRITSFSLVLSCLGAMCTYLILGAVFLKLFLIKVNFFFLRVDNHVQLTWIIALIVTPICSVHDYSLLRYTAIYSIVAILFTSMAVAIAGPIVAEYDYDDITTDNNDAVNYWSGQGSVKELGAIIFSLTCSNALFHVYSGQHRQERENNWNTLNFVTIFTALITFVFIGFGGYLSFRQETSDIILLNFQETAVGNVMFIVIFLHILCIIPQECFVFRASLLDIFEIEQQSLTRWQTVGVTSVLLAMVAGINSMLWALSMTEGETFRIVIDITGAVACSMLSFVLPGMIYYKVMVMNNDQPSPSALLSNSALFLVVFGVFVLIAVPILTILEKGS